MSQQNTAMCEHSPGLQRAWDSTSMGELKLCPRRYQYRILEGWTPKTQSVHLTFGIAFHSALETYDRALASGAPKVEATRVAVRKVLKDTWDPVLKRPWMSQDKYKNRETLLRTVVWYLENFSEDSIETVVLADGKPAVELHFNIPLPRETPEDGPFVLVGYLDKIGKLAGQTFIIDRKTTKHTLSSDYFRQYSPDNQFSTYIFAGSVGFGQQISGLIVDVAQVLIEGSRFQREIINRTPGEIDEWIEDFNYWLSMAEFFAEKQHWPMNDKNCHTYGGCPFREVCTKPPSVRENYLKQGFEKKIWDPIKLRGDI